MIQFENFKLRFISLTDRQFKYQLISNWEPVNYIINLQGHALAIISSTISLSSLTLQISHPPWPSGAPTMTAPVVTTLSHWTKEGNFDEEYLFWDNQTYMNQLRLGK